MSNLNFIWWNWSSISLIKVISYFLESMTNFICIGDSLLSCLDEIGNIIKVFMSNWWNKMQNVLFKWIHCLKKILVIGSEMELFLSLVINNFNRRLKICSVCFITIKIFINWKLCTSNSCRKNFYVSN
jgi:hypothetical protein